MNKSNPSTPKVSLRSHIAPYLKGYPIWMILAVILSVISSVITVVGPDKIKEITDTIIEGIATEVDLDKVSKVAVLLVTLYAIGAIVSYLSNFMIATMIQGFAQRIRDAIATKINRVPLAYFDSHEQGDTLSRVTNDVDLMTQSFNQSLSSMVSSSVLLVGSIFMMFKTNWHLALTAIGSVLAGFALSTIIIAKSQPLFKKQQKNLANISSYVEEVYTGHQVVTSYNARHQAKSAFDGLNEELHDSMWKSQFFSGVMLPLMQFVGNFGYVMVCVVGAALALDDVITMGTIVEIGRAHV